MTLQEFYAQIGGSYADTVRRLCSESFVLRFVKKYPANPSFDELCEAVDRSDWESAFRAAHTLKGVSGNLAMTELFGLMTQQVAAFRANDWDKAVELMPEITIKYETVLAAIQTLD